VIICVSPVRWLIDRFKFYFYYCFDDLGTVAALSDVNGVIVERYSYDVFGEPNRVSDVNNPYMFTGRRIDPETGLYYYRARYYSPNLGRFLQPDPITMLLQLVSTKQDEGRKVSGRYLSARAVQRFLQTDPIGRFLWKDPAGRLFQATSSSGFYIDLNLYTFCGNNPVRWIDPFGLLCKDNKELKELKRKYRQILWKLRAKKGLLEYLNCYEYQRRIMEMRRPIETDHYKLREEYGKSTWLSFGPPRRCKPGEQPAHSFVEVYHVDHPDTPVLYLDPWTVGNLSGIGGNIGKLQTIYKPR